MTEINKDNKVLNSMKWSMITEILAKLILPITNMILARILLPKDFGVIAIINMFLTGIDIFTDAGFGKYLVQKNFHNLQEKENAENVAFWTNLSFSLLFGFLLILFSNSLAVFFKNEELVGAFRLISLILIFTSFSSIQQNIMRRDFEFKKLFYIRTILTLVPIFVTLPLAYFYRSFWSLIIGQFVTAILNTILLMAFGKWRPKVFYSFKVLKGMLNFSIWSMFESVGHWLLFWLDTFFASYFFSEYYLGLYKNTQNMVFSIFSIITASMSAVLLSTLSRIEDKIKFENIYLNIQRLTSYILFPMSFGLMFFSKNVTLILLGNRWIESANIFIAGGFMMLFNTLFYTFPAEVYKSRGVPRQLFVLQLQYLIFLLPISYFSAKSGFWNLVYFRSASILILTLLSLSRLKNIMRFNIKKLIINLKKPFVSSLPIMVLGIINYIVIGQVNGLINNLLVIGIVGIIQLLWIYLIYNKDIVKLVKEINSI